MVFKSPFPQHSPGIHRIKKMLLLRMCKGVNSIEGGEKQVEKPSFTQYSGLWISSIFIHAHSVICERKKIYIGESEKHI